MLLQADEVVITAAPDLANLRNAKNIVDLLQQSRAQRQQAAPRDEHGQHAEAAGDHASKEFEHALGLKAIGVIDFDSETFGQAANNGQMIEELDAKAKVGRGVPRHRAGDQPTGARRQGREEDRRALGPAVREAQAQALRDTLDVR